MIFNLMKFKKPHQFLHFIEIMAPYFLILFVTLFLIFPQIKSRAFIAGIDSWFHMNRFYDTAMQIRTRHFSYFISMFGFNQTGRVVNAVYGPGFAYLGGLILLVARTWQRFEVIQTFLILWISGALMYLAARKNYVNRIVSTLIGVLYLLSQPVMSWAIFQEFTGVGAMLFPLILWQATKMVRKRKIYPVYLALTIAIIFQAHALTTLIGLLTLIPFFLLTWYRTNHRVRLWINLLISMALTLLLTANVWGADLNFLPNRLVPPAPQNNLSLPTKVIHMSKPWFDSVSIIGNFYTLVLLIGLVLGIIGVLFWHQTDGLFKITFLSGVFFCWLSSQWFPWNSLLKICLPISYQLQYPKRFLCAAISLLLLSISLLLNSHDSHLLFNHRIIVRLIEISLLILIGFVFQDQQNQIISQIKNYKSQKVINFGTFHPYHINSKMAYKMRQAYHSTDLTKSPYMEIQATPDYLPTLNKIRSYRDYHHTAVYSGVWQDLDLPGRKFKHQVFTNRLRLLWRQSKPQFKVLPLVKYKDTEVFFNSHLRHHVRINRIGGISGYFSRGYHSVSIRYQQPRWLTLLMWITLLSWLSMIGILIKKVFNTLDS